MGGCTLFDAYRLTILKVFPNLFVNSVWLMPLVANASFIQFLPYDNNRSVCFKQATGRENHSESEKP